MLLVRWERDGIPEEIREREEQFQKNYLGMFPDKNGQSGTRMNSGMNSFIVEENCNIPAQTQVHEAQQGKTLGNPNPIAYKKRSLHADETQNTHLVKPCKRREPSPTSCRLTPLPRTRRRSAAANRPRRSPSCRLLNLSLRLLDSAACNLFRSCL